MKIFGRYVLLVVAMFLFQMPMWILESKLDIDFTFWEIAGWINSTAIAVLSIIFWNRIIDKE